MGKAGGEGGGLGGVYVLRLHTRRTVVVGGLTGDRAFSGGMSAKLAVDDVALGHTVMFQLKTALANMKSFVHPGDVPRADVRVERRR